MQSGTTAIISDIETSSLGKEFNLLPRDLEEELSLNTNVGSLLLEAELQKPFISFGNHKDSFYVCFACELCSLNNAKWYVNELRAQVSYVLKRCLPGNEPFVFFNVNFSAQWQQAIYQYLITEIPYVAEKVDDKPDSVQELDDEYILEYIDSSRIENAANYLDKMILCFLHNVFLKESFSDTEVFDYNPCLLNENVMQIFHKENSLCVASLGKDLFVLEYGALVEVMSNEKCSDVFFEAYVPKINKCIKDLQTAFYELLSRTDVNYVKILVNLLGQSQYELTDAKKNYICKLLGQLNVNGYETFFTLLGEHVGYAFLQKLVSFPYELNFEQNDWQPCMFSHIDILDLAGKDLVFFRLLNDKSSYGFDSIYFMIFEYAKKVHDIWLCDPFSMRQMLFKTVEMCLQGGQDALKNYELKDIIWENTDDFKQYVRTQIEAKSKAYKVTPLDYIKSVVLYGPLDDTCKIVLSVILQMEIHEFDLDSNIFEYKYENFNYENQVLLMRDCDFESNCSYYMMTTLDRFATQDLSQIVWSCDNFRFYAKRHSLQDYERRKVQAVRMFTVAINYQHVDKYMVHCPVSSYTYLLPIMLFCLKNQVLAPSYKSLDDLKIFRQNIVDFFIKKKQDYQGRVDNLEKRILSIRDRREKIQEHEEDFCLEKYLSNHANDFPFELMQMVIDFTGIAICLHGFDDADHFLMQPKHKKCKTAKALSQFATLDDGIIQLQLIGEHYNLLTYNENWQIDPKFLGFYANKTYMPAYSLSKGSKKDCLKLGFAEQVQTYEYDKVEEPPKELARDEISTVKLKA